MQRFKIADDEMYELKNASFTPTAIFRISQHLITKNSSFSENRDKLHRKKKYIRVVEIGNVQGIPELLVTVHADSKMQMWPLQIKMADLLFNVGMCECQQRGFFLSF